MQTISGILRVVPDHARKGDTTIDFDNIPARRARIGNAELHQPTWSTTTVVLSSRHPGEDGSLPQHSTAEPSTDLTWRK